MHSKQRIHSHKNQVWHKDKSQEPLSDMAHQVLAGKKGQLGKQAHLTSRLKSTAFGPQQNILEVQFDVVVDVRHGGDLR